MRKITKKFVPPKIEGLKRKDFVINDSLLEKRGRVGVRGPNILDDEKNIFHRFSMIKEREFAILIEGEVGFMINVISERMNLITFEIVKIKKDNKPERMGDNENIEIKKEGDRERKKLLIDNNIAIEVVHKAITNLLTSPNDTEKSTYLR